MQLRMFVNLVAKGDTEAVKNCLAQTSIHVSALLGDRPPLAALTLSGLVDENAKCAMAKLLLDAGANADFAYSSGRTALHYFSCSASIMKLLLAAKLPPNVNAKTSEDNQCTPLHVHAYYDNGEQCEVLIEAKADVNATDANGNTPLMVAVQSGSLVAVRVLLTSRADVSHKNKQGETASTCAGIPRCLDLVRQQQDTKVVRLCGPDSHCFLSAEW